MSDKEPQIASFDSAPACHHPARLHRPSGGSDHRRRCGHAGVVPVTRFRSAFAGFLLLLAGFLLWQFREAWDVALYWQLHVGAPGHVLVWLIRLTNLGGAAVMIPVALVAVGRLATTRRRVEAIWLFATIATGRVLIEVAKIVCARARPALTDRLVAVDSASFPSSHSAGAMLTCLAICLAFRVRRNGWIAGLAFALAIGASRIALGVHWPSDVLGGWGLGLLWFGLAARVLPDAGRDFTAASLWRPAALGAAFVAMLLVGLHFLRMPAAADEVRRIPAIEARQGVAAGPFGIYAIGDSAIARLDRASGQPITRWQGDPARFQHINSCTTVGPDLVCAVSNFPALPMRSSVEWFDAQNLFHLATRPMAPDIGSLTWVDWHAGSWWACYANYDGHGGTPGRNHRATILIRYDGQWKEQARYAFPATMLGRLAPHSASGGSWGPDGLLYVTGHDRPETYALRLPAAGTVMTLVATLALPTHGQAIAWDPILPRTLWSIERNRRLLIATRLPAVLPGHQTIRPLNVIRSP
jgi:membrane-associated phospholipid phosphatase